MEKSDRETHDFMNVESFSQLPFIRPSPAKEKGIRLFGKEFCSRKISSGELNDESESAETNAGQDPKETNDSSNGESGRRFECHYCCRNFPTSQALGGHQNAHKRERQHAKRAQLHSAMVQNSLSDGHLYGLMNYRFAGAPSPALSAYPTWNSRSNTISSSPSRYYGNPSSNSVSPPINGNPLAVWRIAAVQNNPSFNRDRSSHQLPLFSGDDLKASQIAAAIGGSPHSRQSRYVFEQKQNVQDQLSLDLHL